MTTKKHCMLSEICPHSNVRIDACSCSICSRNKTPSDIYHANLRDIKLLLKMIAALVRKHSHRVSNHITWGNVGDVAHLRYMLMEILLSFRFESYDYDDDCNTRLRVEKALCSDEDHVSEALAEAVF